MNQAMKWWQFRIISHAGYLLMDSNDTPCWGDKTGEDVFITTNPVWAMDRAKEIITMGFSCWIEPELGPLPW